MGSNRFWHIVSVVKERLASLSSRVASSEPIKNSILSGIVNTPFRSFFLFHKIPQPRLYLYHSAPGSIILRRAAGASNGPSLKSSRLRQIERGYNLSPQVRRYDTDRRRA